MTVLARRGTDSGSSIRTNGVFRRLHETTSGLVLASAFAVGMAACSSSVPSPNEFRRDAGMDAVADVRSTDTPASDGRMVVDGGNGRACVKEGKVTTVTQNGEPEETQIDTCKAEDVDGGTRLSEKTAVKFSCAPDGSIARTDVDCVEGKKCDPAAGPDVCAPDCSSAAVTTPNVLYVFYDQTNGASYARKEGETVELTPELLGESSMYETRTGRLEFDADGKARVMADPSGSLFFVSDNAVVVTWGRPGGPGAETLRDVSVVIDFDNGVVYLSKDGANWTDETLRGTGADRVIVQSRWAGDLRFNLSDAVLNVTTPVVPNKKLFVWEGSGAASVMTSANPADNLSIQHLGVTDSGVLLLLGYRGNSSVMEVDTGNTLDLGAVFSALAGMTVQNVIAADGRRTECQVGEARIALVTGDGVHRTGTYREGGSFNLTGCGASRTVQRILVAADGQGAALITGGAEPDVLLTGGPGVDVERPGVTCSYSLDSAQNAPVAR